MAVDTTVRETILKFGSHSSLTFPLPRQGAFGSLGGNSNSGVVTQAQFSHLGCEDKDSLCSVKGHTVGALLFFLSSTVSFCLHAYWIQVECK